MLKKSNFKEWFNRYKYAELAAITAVLLSSQFSRICSGITASYIITFSEYFAFYVVILFIEYRNLAKANRLFEKRTTLKEFGFLLRNMMLEFGYPSILDFFIIRPFCMYWMPILTQNHFMGIVLGKITADFFFYALAILNYELLKKKT